MPSSSSPTPCSRRPASRSARRTSIWASSSRSGRPTASSPTRGTASPRTTSPGASASTPTLRLARPPYGGPAPKKSGPPAGGPDSFCGSRDEPLELEADTHRRADGVGREVVTVRQAVVHAAPYRADVAVKALGEAVVGQEARRLVAATAFGIGLGRAAHIRPTRGEGVLRVLVVSASEVEL